MILLIKQIREPHNSNMFHKRVNISLLWGFFFDCILQSLLSGKTIIVRESFSHHK